MPATTHGPPLGVPSTQLAMRSATLAVAWGGQREGSVDVVRGRRRSQLQGREPRVTAAKATWTSQGCRDRKRDEDDACPLLYSPRRCSEDVYELSWVSDPRIAPDGRSVAFVVWRVDREADDVRSAIWLGPSRLLALAASRRAGKARPVSALVAGRRQARVRLEPGARGEVALSDSNGRRRGSAADGAWTRSDRARPGRLTEPAWLSGLAFADGGGGGRQAPRPRRFSRLQYKLDDEGWTGDRRRHICHGAGRTGRPRRRSSQTATTRTIDRCGRRTAGGSRALPCGKTTGHRAAPGRLSSSGVGGGRAYAAHGIRRLAQALVLGAGRFADRVPVRSRWVRRSLTSPRSRPRRRHW